MQGLRKLLEFEGNIEETFMQNFQISYTAFDSVRTHDLKEGAADIPLTNENRQGSTPASRAYLCLAVGQRRMTTLTTTLINSTK